MVLELPVETYPDANPKLDDLRQQRQALNDYVRTLHQPQQPIGLSMYELHGHLARLTRIGMLGRSRIEFSEPHLVSRSTLDNWIQLLRLAPQHQNVLTKLQDHPWRGCRLTNQTLALKSDVLNHFVLLSNLAAQLTQELNSLEEADLIPKSTKTVELEAQLRMLEVNLTIPDIPATWFASPREIACALLDRHRAHRRTEQLRDCLSEYVDEITTLFSEISCHFPT